MSRGVDKVDGYRIKTAFIGLKRLATLPQEDKQACIDAYKFFQRMQAGEETKTADRPLGRLTATGVSLDVVVLMPSWPYEFAPQQYSKPSSRMAQV